jgi:hypothetical protein
MEKIPISSAVGVAVSETPVLYKEKIYVDF